MKRLGRKQTTNNADFVHVWNHIEQYVSYREAQELVEKTVLEVRQNIRGKKVGYAWSGGKDSLALQYICERAGVNLCVIGISRPLELRSFIQWVEQNKPPMLEIYDAGIDLDYLVSNPQMLFPYDSALIARWYALIHHKAQDWFYEKHDLDMILLGRRVLDGNYIGKGSNIYTNRNGVTRYSPIAYWSHEQVMAVIHYFMNRNIPSIYNNPEGWIKSTGVWPVQCSGTEEGWNYYWQVDQSIVEYAATKIESAKQFLNSKQNGK